MLIPDNSGLDASFEELRLQLADPDRLSPAHADPLCYFVYDPSHILAVRSLLPGWIARLRNENGLAVERLSLSEVMWELIDASGRWEEWLELEPDSDQDKVNDAVRDVLLRGDDTIMKKVLEFVSVRREHTVVLITDVELLHPYLRSRVIEGHLKNKVQVPTVFFYPGRRAGQYDLYFLGIHQEDSGYRSPIYGGLA